MDMAKQGEPKTAWGQHVRAWMAGNPGVPYKEALQKAKATYAKTGKAPARPAAVVRAAPKVAKVARVKPARRVAKVGNLTPWQEHMAGIRVSHPELGLKEAMVEAKRTYERFAEKPKPVERKAPPVVPIQVLEIKAAVEPAAKPAAKTAKGPSLIGFGLAEAVKVEAKEPEMKEEMAAPVWQPPRECVCGRRGKKCRCRARGCASECCTY